MVFTLPVVAKAQEKSKRPGTWTLVKSLRTLPYQYQHSIGHSDDEFTIVERYTREGKHVINRIKLYVNGGGESNFVDVPISPSPVQKRSRTRWKKRVLERRSKYRETVRDRSRERSYNIEVVEEWEMSRDSQTLTLRSVETRTSAGGSDGPGILPPPVASPGNGGTRPLPRQPKISSPIVRQDKSVFVRKNVE